MVRPVSTTSENACFNCVLLGVILTHVNSVKGARGSSGDQPHDAQTSQQVCDSGQLRRHVPRGEPQRIGPVRQDNATRLLGTQLRLPAQLLLQRFY